MSETDIKEAMNEKENIDRTKENIDRTKENIKNSGDIKDDTNKSDNINKNTTENNKPKKKKKKKKKKKFGPKPRNFARIKLEFQRLITNSPWGIQMATKGSSLSEYIGIILGPPDTPYYNGKFYLNIKFTDEYPYLPPKITFKTKIYHCNVSHDGSICLDILKDNWSPALNIDKVLLSIQQLLITPNPDDPLVPEIAKQLKNDPDNFEKTAKVWTEIHAMNLDKKNNQNKDNNNNKDNNQEDVNMKNDDDK